MRYKKTEKLVLKKKIRITEEAWKVLKEEKKKQGISMAKIVSNLILDKYNKKLKLLCIVSHF